MAYSINSDSGNVSTEDSLYLIDLASGADQRRGGLNDGIDDRIDTEGLALDPDGTLWGIDDASLTLFPINTMTGTVRFQDEIPLASFPIGGGNDFGMTFSCDGSLYVTSVVTRSLYQLGMNGSSETKGVEGGLGANISAIAAYGNPVQLYGLGNGQFEDGTTDSPNLYSIDVDTGVAQLIGPLGAEAGEYKQGGLAFDSDGTLWAITDRRNINNRLTDEPSQILQINVDTGTATLVSTTTEVGFESLAIAPPSGCVSDVGGDEDYPHIPVLNPVGSLLTIIVLLLSGLVFLRKRIF